MQIFVASAVRHFPPHIHLKMAGDVLPQQEILSKIGPSDHQSPSASPKLHYENRRRLGVLLRRPLADAGGFSNFGRNASSPHKAKRGMPMLLTDTAL
jgi:hypothetical protein